MVLKRATKVLIYALGFLIAAMLSSMAFSILVQMGFDDYSAFVLSIIPFVLFSGAWYLTLKVVFKV